MVRDIKEESLISKLYEELRPAASIKEKRTFFWKRKGTAAMDKWIKNNTASKLIALAVSILLWAMVHMDSGTPAPPTTFYDTKIIEGVKIQTYGFDDGEYALTGIDQDRVNLEVRGRNPIFRF